MGKVRAAAGLLSVALVSAGTAGVLFAQPARAAACTDNWQGPTTGVQSWFVAGNWSTGVPGSSDVACIKLPGTYTVDMTSGTTVGSVNVGGAAGKQTLAIDGASTNVFFALNGQDSVISAHGALALNPTSSGYALIDGSASIINSGTVSTSALTGSAPAYLRMALTNAAGGTVTIAAPDTRQDDGTVTSNSSAFTVASGGQLALTAGSSFTNAAGTLTVAGALNENSGTFTASGGTETGNPVVLSGGTLADGAGTGAFDVVGTSTLTGNIPTGQTVTIDGAFTNVYVTLPGAVNVHGTLAMNPTASGYALVAGAGSVSVASGGAFSTTALPGSAQTYLRVPLTNAAGGTVTIAAPNAVQDNGTVTSNSGTFTVASGGQLALTAGSSFTNAAGTLTVLGSFNENGGTFTASGGTQTGNPVVLSAGTLADGAGTGAFDVIGSSTLTGDIPAGQAVTVDGASASVFLTLPGSVTVHGSLAVNPTAAGFAGLTGIGSVSVASGATLSTSAVSGSAPAYLRVPLTNAAGGTVTIAAPNTLQDQGTLTSNSGTFTIASAGQLSLGGGSSFTNAAGTLTVTGGMSQGGGTFTASGGTQSGNPVVLSGLTLADSAGAGAFDVTGSSTLTGNIPVGQTVTVDGAVASVFVALPGLLTVHGTLAVDPTAGGFAGLNGAGSVLVASGGTFSTAAMTGSAPAYVRVPVTNHAGGTIVIAAPNTLDDQGTVISNSGTFTVSDGGQLSLGGGSTFVNGAAATLGVTVNATNATASGIAGPGVTLAGTLRVQTIGSPALGATFVPITGPVSGTFGSFAFGAHAYSVSYPSGAVQLTTTDVYTLSPTSFSPHKNIPTGPVQVATIGNASNGTGTYSATVDWGDNKPMSTATVNITGNTGTVTAPSHTYAASGPFVVTTSVNNSDGTMLSTSITVTVPALTVTAVSPLFGPVAGGQTVTVTGTGFTGATAVKFGTAHGTAVTVQSDTQLTVTSPAHPAGRVDIRIVTPGGTSTLVTADRYTYQPAPTITAVSPNAGPLSGGQRVAITGTNLDRATSVKFGAAPGTSLVVVSGTKIMVTTPAHTAGLVDVTVTTPGGTSATATADHYTYQPVPNITTVSPKFGPIAGGQTVTITGTGFTGATAVKFGTAHGTAVTVQSDTQLTVTSPAHPAGRVDIRVVTPGGTSTLVTADRYTYQPAPTITAVSPNAGPLSGGQRVAITGTNLDRATSVKFGAAPGTSLVVVSGTKIMVTTPAHTAGLVDVTVTTPGGTSATATADHYTYQPVPNITTVSPKFGPIAGGQTVTITGTGFTGATAVKFGTAHGTAVTVQSDTQLTVTSPAHPAGRVDIRVVTPGGTSTLVTADRYRYTV